MKDARKNIVPSTEIKPEVVDFSQSAADVDHTNGGIDNGVFQHNRDVIYSKSGSGR